jgi:hypothetical protein
MMEENPVRHGRHALLSAVAEKHRQRFKTSTGGRYFQATGSNAAPSIPLIIDWFGGCADAAALWQGLCI